MRFLMHAEYSGNAKLPFSSATRGSDDYGFPKFSVSLESFNVANHEVSKHHNSTVNNVGGGVTLSLHID
jgi:hypothetical protein